MERGLYAAASGMVSLQAIQETIARNIANSTTVGYKRDMRTFRATQTMMLSRLNDGSGRGTQIGELGTGCKADPSSINWEAGSYTRTDNSLDAALPQGLFFAVQTPAGERYTRAGDFHADANGRLLTSGNLPVLDTNGVPIVVAGKTDLKLDNSGNLTSGGQTVARLKIVRADLTKLDKQGASLFNAKAAGAVVQERNPAVYSGMLEMSNTNTVMDLVQMVNTSRGFDMAQKALVTQDELLKQAASEVGKV